ncbi:hypothetical protein [Hymenobacter fodinae]|uniref:Uncharacterized protein n=1 Tax=Hymenobacter fodinae TaxID=2510796 RepID=A0A4Z0P705_9BACT|nr:hypothetical protein [Hymenobacter fodinae]TGE08182.1 hypothetical protein EU556_10665 [Hymenobacter fodinae]
MEPNPTSPQPTPGPNTLPAKGTTDTQRTDADAGTNLPPPATPPAAAPATPAEPEATPDSESETTEAPTDPSATSQSDPAGEADPGASNTSNDEPL